MHTSLSFGMLNQLHHLPQSYLQDNRTYPHIRTQPLHPTPTSLYPVELSESDSATTPEHTLHFITSLFPTFTFSSFISSPAFHFLIFSNRLSSDSAISTKSSAYSSSHGNPHLAELDNASSTIVNSSGLSTEP